MKGSILVKCAGQDCYKPSHAGRLKWRQCASKATKKLSYTSHTTGREIIFNLCDRHYNEYVSEKV